MSALLFYQLKLNVDLSFVYIEKVTVSTVYMTVFYVE